MILRLSDTFAANTPKEVAPLLKILALQLSDSYADFVELHRASFFRYEQRAGVLKAGFFTKQDLAQLLIHAGAVQGVNIPTLSALLDRLLEWSLVTDNDLGDDAQFARYHWNASQIGLFSALKIIDNVLFGRTYIVDKYTESVPAVVVEKSGVERIGTSFLVHDSSDGRHFNGRGHLLTAKHNVDPADGINFLRLESTGQSQYEIESPTWILHPDQDIAAVRVLVKGPAQPIYPLSAASVLSPTISLGYPKISSIDRAYLLAHNGEINAIAKSYLDRQEYLLISNAVSPGNSGGPVLDDLGLCVGMIVRSLEAEYEGELSRANAAIPAVKLLAFISSIGSSP